jgi:hypothetical protein
MSSCAHDLWHKLANFMVSQDDYTAFIKHVGKDKTDIQNRIASS